MDNGHPHAWKRGKRGAGMPADGASPSRRRLGKRSAAMLALLLMLVPAICIARITGPAERMDGGIAAERFAGRMNAALPASQPLREFAQGGEGAACLPAAP